MEKCSRCEAEFEENHLIQKTRTRHGIEGKTDLFCGPCWLATRLLMETRGPITPRNDMAVHPVRVYSRALGKVVQDRHGKEETVHGAYDRLLTKSVKRHAPEWLKNHLIEAEKAIQGELAPFDERGKSGDKSEQQTLRDNGDAGSR